MALMMMAAAGFAQLPGGNIYVGYALNHASAEPGGSSGNLNGWEVSGEAKVAPFVGIVGDLGAQYGTLKIPASYAFGTVALPAQTRVVTYMAGPRVSVSVGKFRPFAHALIGAAHLHQDLSQYAAAYTHGETCVSDAIGGGVDYKILPFIGVRVQGDALQTRFHGQTQNDARITTGVVFRF
jgi:hypothetical protein